MGTNPEKYDRFDRIGIFCGAGLVAVGAVVAIDGVFRSQKVDQFLAGSCVALFGLTCLLDQGPDLQIKQPENTDPEAREA